MVTIAETPEEQSSGRWVEERIEEHVREIVAGDKRGAVRRILLYLLTFALLVSPFPLLAVVPLALLAMTDVLS